MAVPADIPVTNPQGAQTFATVVSELVHMPPGMTSVKIILLPTPTFVPPVIAAGVAFTVTTVVTALPYTIYVITEVPAASPLTVPVDEPTIATAVLLLLQVPPVVASDKVIEEPVQTVAVPVMDDMPLTVIVAVT